MTYWDRKLIREQLDKRLKGSLVQLLQADYGWIKLLRDALGMSTTQLAKRVGIDQSRISRLEHAEIDGDLKLSSLKKIAEGLNLRFVYGFVPKDSFEQVVKEQAQKIAKKRMDRVNHTMRLEEQELSVEEKAKAFDDLVQKILLEDAKDFWDQ
ncbi:mobile mystery protein A [Siphonobacter sp. SORGH_AS_0500]|uniref:mobile mystery protein A n=1 Tax=Siphonobacter sp. SORGH_AS_0500 TaxID=1864824 RepID=UPI00285AFB58|nr:mobile mystery protein A [Siphonobacter sp. SORGH_AS_0500]MDR6193320.1 putative DNA-binding mobile mystery protein A [Siphonobacter sp. SORGH_AS_0500]